MLKLFTNVRSSTFKDYHFQSQVLEASAARLQHFLFVHHVALTVRGRGAQQHDFHLDKIFKSSQHTFNSHHSCVDRLRVAYADRL